MATRDDYAVRAETKEGAILTLRIFETREEAEAHPVKLSLWKRVWVAKVQKAEPPPVASLRRPWKDEWAASFTYIRDADGRRILSLWGTAEQRRRLVGILKDAGLL